MRFLFKKLLILHFFLLFKSVFPNQFDGYYTAKLIIAEKLYEDYIDFKNGEL